jgi:pteridine reductase
MPVNDTKEKGVALITGGARRVGRAIALRLADEGFDIAFTYHTSTAPAQQLRDEITQKGRQCLALTADLTEPQPTVNSIYTQFSAKFTRLDLLVNNASLYQPDAPGGDGITQSHRFWAIHVISPMLLSQKFSPMLQSARGSIVNMVDFQAERPIPNYLAYCASKAGLSNLTLGLARQLAPNIRVNAIAPGVIDWPPDLPQEKRDQYLRRVPLARAGTPDDAASAVLFLATAAQYITGQILRLDGGRSIT